MSPTTLIPIARDSLRARVYEHPLHPHYYRRSGTGTPRRDQDIAEQLGVSRTPVREALQRLEDEGLVETRRGSLTRIVALDTEAGRDAFPVVAILHALATRLATPRMGPDDLDALRRANQDLAAAMSANDVMAAMAADDHFICAFWNAPAIPSWPTLDRLMPKVHG